MSDQNTQNNGAIHIEDDDARAASTPGVMRYVLAISLLLAIIAMSAIWIIPALYEGDVEGAKTASERVEEMREDGATGEEIPAPPGASDESTLEEPTAEELD